MLLSTTRGHVACITRGRSIVVQAAKKGGSGSKKNKGPRRMKPDDQEVQRLLGEYSAVKQSPGTNGTPAPPSSGRPAAPDRNKRQTTEASATTQSHTNKPIPTEPGSSSSSSSVKQSTPAVTPPAASSSKTAAEIAPTAEQHKPAPAAAAAKDQDSSSKPSSSSSSSSVSESPGSAPPLPVAPPLPDTFKAAGTRISSFESKLTSRQPAAAAAAAAGDGSGVGAPAASIARLAAAADGLSAAGDHVAGLAQLLREAQDTLMTLRSDTGSSPGDPAAAAVSAAADSLVGMMSDVLSDITAEMGLVREQLHTAWRDVSDTKQHLETGTQPLPPGKTSKKATAEEDIELIAAREAAAVAAAAAAAKREAEIKQTLELRDAELAVAQQRNSQLQAQIALLVPNKDGLDPAAAAAAAAAGTTSDPRVHQLLVAQVASNMAMLDWLGALAKTVVGLEGVSPKDRVKLATTISKCVLAVGGGSKPNSPASSRPTSPQQQQQQPPSSHPHEEF